jgi:glycosyltransferase involved in cell wall biosynthesis
MDEIGMSTIAYDYVGWHIAVLIPARNEELLLPRCLDSVLTARATLPPGVTSDVVVVSDNSTDRTIELAQTLLCSNGAVLQADAGRVGIARAMAAQVALERHQGLLSRCWFANTDADCEVPSTWLLDHLQIACKGYAAVAGIVDVHDFSEHLPIVEESFRRAYRIEADGTHPHVHGANLGIRADAYVMAGGWGALATGEDHDLWGRLQIVGGSQLSDARLQVLTSGRRVGRAPSGFAEALAAHRLMVAA